MLSSEKQSNSVDKSKSYLVVALAIASCCILSNYAQMAEAQAIGGGFMGPSSGYGAMGGAAAASSADSSQVQQTTTKQTTSTSAGSSAAASGAAAGGIGVMGGMAGSASAASGAAASTTTQETTTQKTTTANSAASASAAGGASMGYGGMGYEAGMGGYMGESGAASSSAAAASSASSASAAGGMGAMGGMGVGMGGASSASAASSASSSSAASAASAAGASSMGMGMGAPMMPGYGMGYDPTLGAAASSGALAAAGPYGDMGAGEALAGAAAGAAAVDGGPIVAPGTLLARQALATDALSNAQAESAIAGADMVAHGANNARSASLASNAYRQAKLASARDRVNIAGTIQNTARISDAAIATHDAATKAEDSLLGSELAVDSAGTVLDSDGAYIPPVTASLLRSLPYGRLGIRNILPKPLTHSSNLLPDVWLNGQPVNYQNIPLRMLPYGIGGSMVPTIGASPYFGAGVGVGVGAAAAAASAASAGGQMVNGQILMPNNGIPLSSRYFDPSAAYIVGSMRGIMDSSVLPVLANGQLEAHDEVAMANMLRVQQENGPGMLGTNGGYGRINAVPMLTGTVSDVNLMPTTTTGTTYPIGSALVIEPRDSFFQDYVDNASSRQNFDERQQ